MKNILILAILAAMIAPLGTGCSDDINADPTLSEPPYTLVQGAAGSIDATIYDIHQKYGNIILYDFTDVDILPAWYSTWAIAYTTADTSEEGKYVHKMLDVVTKNLYEVYGENFAKQYFPYLIFFCETLDKAGSSPTPTDVEINSRGKMAISKVGAAQDGMTTTQWDTFIFKLQRMLATHYHSKLPSLPSKFFTYVADVPSTIPAAGSAPSGMGWTTNNHRCWSSGFIKGESGTNNVRPSAAFDLNDFYIFLTTTGKTEMENRFKYYPKLKERTILVYEYFEEVFKVDLVAMQNKNVPDDKLPAGFFENL